MGLLEGKRALVTGGGSGIGAATCRRFAEEGAAVAVLDVRGDAARAVAAEVDGIAYEVDVTDFSAMAWALREADERLGGLTTLFNNAGTSNLSPVHAYDEAEWDRILRVNLTGVFHGFKAGAPLLLANGGGAIVSTASISGTRPSAGEAPYAAAKAAVAALTATAALEYAPTIRVNAVSPGMIHTGLTDPLLDRPVGRPPHDGQDAAGPDRHPRGHRRRGVLPEQRPGPLRLGPEPGGRRRHDPPRRRRRRPPRALPGHGSFRSVGGVRRGNRLHSRWANSATEGDISRSRSGPLAADGFCRKRTAAMGGCTVGATRTKSRWVRGILAGAVLTLAVTAAACDPRGTTAPRLPRRAARRHHEHAPQPHQRRARRASAWPASSGTRDSACLATEWSNVMAGGRGLAHRDLNGTIRSPGFESYASLGENIFVGPEAISPDSIHSAWMNSPPHAANILGNYDAMGIGWAKSANGQLWVTENFGRHM